MNNLIQKILKFERVSKRYILILVDLIIAYVAHLFGSLIIILYYNYYYEKIIISDLTLVNLIFVPILIGIFLFFNIYKNLIRYIDFRFFINLFKSFLVYYLIYLLIFLFFTTFIYAFLVVTYQILITFILIITSKILMKILVENSIFNSTNLNIDQYKEKVIIYGANDIGAKIAQNIKLSNKFELICFVDEDEKLNDQLLGNFKIFDITNLSDILKRYNISQVILAFETKEQINKNEIINQFIEHKLKIKIFDDSDFFSDSINFTKLKDFDFEIFLSRKEINIYDSKQYNLNFSKSFLITGAGGSIGSEISKQLINYNPKKILLIDHSELLLFNIYNKIISMIPNNKNIIIKPVLGNVSDINLIENLLDSEKIETIFHCAAYKHVDLVEKNKVSGLINNLSSTIVCAELASKYKIKNFVLISSDKAVFPSTLMGASKRLSEIFIQSIQNKKNNYTSFSAVRFGNVLNSSGSVIPIFKDQILSGGPVTVRDKSVSRYFMTIHEAVNLVIVTSIISKPGKIYILDMGQPIKILDLAKQMINFYGYDYNVREDITAKHVQDPKIIEIVFTGLKKSEKLHEELIINKKNYEIIHDKIFQENENNIYDYIEIKKSVSRIITAAQSYNIKEMKNLIKLVIKDNKL